MNTKETQPDYDKLFKQLLSKFVNSPYFKQHKLALDVTKVQENLEVNNLIANPDGTYGTHKELKSIWRISIKDNGEEIYFKTISDSTDEAKFRLLQIVYQEIFDSGIQLIRMTYIEMKAMDAEIARITKNKFRA